jgi:hypothetical protein
MSDRSNGVEFSWPYRQKRRRNLADAVQNRYYPLVNFSLPKS